MRPWIKSSQRVYCLGIGGVGVGALAEYLHRQGCQVTGSDNTSSQIRVNCRVSQALGSYRFVTRGASDNKNDPNNGMVAFFGK